MTDTETNWRASRSQNMAIYPEIGRIREGPYDEWLLIRISPYRTSNSIHEDMQVLADSLMIQFDNDRETIKFSLKNVDRKIYAKKTN